MKKLVIGVVFTALIGLNAGIVKGWTIEEKLQNGKFTMEMVGETEDVFISASKKSISAGFSVLLSTLASVPGTSVVITVDNYPMGWLNGRIQTVLETGKIVFKFEVTQLTNGGYTLTIKDVKTYTGRKEVWDREIATKIAKQYLAYFIQTIDSAIQK